MSELEALRAFMKAEVNALHLKMRRETAKLAKRIAALEALAPAAAPADGKTS